MHFLILLSLLIGSTSLAEETSFLYCKIANQPQHSTLRITMDKTSPLELALMSPKEQNFRPQKMTIKNVHGDYSKEQHTFIAKPDIQPDMIDWSKHSSCFLEVGTQWYFNFNYSTEVFFVQLLPYFVKETENCVTNRHQPQTKLLNCF